MGDFLKMDIFFAVTTAVVVVAGIFLIIALFYIIRILKSVDRVAANVSEESDYLREDFKILRVKIREEGMKVQHFLDFFGGVAARRSARRKAKNARE